MLQWNDIRGQRRAQDVLERAIAADRMHHAYLFVGPLGVGKFSTALALATALNCLERPSDAFAAGCGRCSACRKIESRQHPDVHTVEPDGQFIKIDQVRAVQKAASTRPYEGRFQVIIIDRAHQMGDEAANAILKTLEEPPVSMRFALITDQPNRLLDTIRSRCQVLRFGSLDPDEVTELLAEKARSLTPPPEAAFLPVAARFAEGSPGRAFALLESGVLERRVDVVRQMLAINPAHPAQLLDVAEAMQKDKQLLFEYLDILKVFLRDVMLVKTLGDAHRCVNQDLPEQIQALANALTMDDVLGRLDVLDRASRLLERPISPQLIAEDLLLKLAPPSPS
ncbi:MAG: DNA polymerase III subunit delta' [bacterium]